MNFVTRYFFIVFVLLFGSCANKVAPEGGAIDKDPPMMLTADPENQNVNFTGKKIVLEFDEFIELDNPSQNIFVSPPLDPKPKYKVVKKTLTIELPDTLKPNITYTINFGDALVDVHEGNIFRDFKYIFSTSSTLDSLVISGRVIQAYDLSPESDCIAVLYEHTLDDTSCFVSLPEYYSRVDENGQFSIENIKPGKYRMMAIADANSNFMADFTEERIAFHENIIELPSSERFELKTFMQSGLEVKPISAKKMPGSEVLVSFTGDAIDYDFKIHNGNVLYSKWNTYRDSVTLYHDVTTDSVAVITTSEQFSDTLWSYRKKRPDSDASVKVAGIERLGNDSLKLIFNKPTKFTQEVSMQINGSTTGLKSLWEENDKYFIQLAIPIPDSNAVLTIDPGALRSYDGTLNDTLKVNLPVLEERQTGSLELNLSPFSTGQTYVELKTESGKVFDQLAIGDGGLFEIYRVIPGQYTLRAFCDLNNNGKWDGGDFYIGKQPEPVKNYNQKITVRANWTIQIDWEIEN